MNRTEIINRLVKNNNFKSYLEIGVRDYYVNCDKVDCEIKHSVDPNPQNKCDFKMTSDKFFDQIGENIKYDLIFIDGLHLTEQVDKDIANSIRHLSENGIIVMHDCLPQQEENQFRNPVISQWTGDVWKSVVRLRTLRDDISIEVVDTDWGCGILRKSTKIELAQVDLSELNWNWFINNYRKIVNVITVEEFEKKY